MSTLACFEKHKQEGRRHEERVKMCLEDLTAGAQSREDTEEPKPGVSPKTASSVQGAPLKALRFATAEQQLAVREYKEACRLRPRDVDARQMLANAARALKKLQASVEGPKPKPMRRFLAHYNLSIRYWDMGKAAQAIEQAEMACKELRQEKLPCGCAEHNLLLMTQVHNEFRAELRGLQETLKRAPDALGPNYELGVHYFDKRMLLHAEAQLRKTRERARAASALQLVAHDRHRHQQEADDILGWPSLQLKKVRRMATLLEDIEDDLDFLSGLKQLWCVEEDAGKTDELQATGVRDGSRPHLLPCMHQRYSQDSRACDAWWVELCRRSDISLHARRRSK